jgi:DNA-binding GntR family transcriptional regulator
MYKKGVKNLSKTVEGKMYLNNEEVQAELGASKKRFYNSIRPQLRVYHFEAKQTPWFLREDVIALKNGKPVRKASISISGIQRDWTSYLSSLGFHAETIDRTIEVTTLPKSAIEFFHLSPEQQFVKRSRMSLADKAPICTWDTYYPYELIQGEIFEEMKQGHVDVVKRIQEETGIVVGVAKDKYTARTATLEEQDLLQLVTNDPVLILQRASYTSDKKTLVLYSDMVLLGNWFAPEHEYQVAIWNQ